ncbi:acyl-CoA dehydrogenase family protein [Nocardioides houyundeii]|uniref:acyl-CoA dehydrogenase family protein n=1 Tax=Nocardioides houyundeii TaxID=2045452 RepID=UPI000DF47538|nr:acyl-CoA dehydrogenase family protein [Nocardioides houyundeii]
MSTIRQRSSTSPSQPVDVQQLRASVREYLATSLPEGHEPGLGMSSGHNPEFSRSLAAQGWVGMAIPTRYGGRGRGAVERFVVAEELLAAGAPVNAHWIADRQIAPSILRFGSEQQKSELLPRISNAELFFSLGMSEPESGSDLASVRTRARQVEGGWCLNGQKIWTSGAHLNDYAVTLCRSDPGAEKHAGLSQFIVDLRADGVTVAPITILDGSAHFNEVTLDDVFVPDDMVLGKIGDGWHQVTSELAFERAGPDRYLSTYQLVQGFLRDDADKLSGADIRREIGRLAARYTVIRQLGLSIAVAIDNGQVPAREAALLKDIGTTFEQQVIETIHSLANRQVSLTSPSAFERLLARAILTGPSFTLRGGTTEVLRMMTGRKLING